MVYAIGALHCCCLGCPAVLFKRIHTAAHRTACTEMWAFEALAAGPHSGGERERGDTGAVSYSTQAGYSPQEGELYGRGALESPLGGE